VTGSTSSLHVTGIAVGGDGVSRDPSGRVVLVAGALPGEVVDAEVVAERKGHAQAVVTKVLDAAPQRIAPPCPFVAAGCGGCGWQHVTPAGQRSLKAAMVADALRRLGGVADPVVDEGPALPPTGYRTTIRGVADADGRVALRRHHSHDLVAVPGCQVAHPLVVEVLAAGRFPPGAEVTVRAGAATGERLVIVDPAGAGDEPAADVAEVPDGVRVVDGRDLASGKRAWIHEEVGGLRYRVSARSFFQSGPAGAAALVEAVDAALAGALDGRTPHLVDLYGGVGLFAAAVAGRPGEAGRRVTLVEASASAVAGTRAPRVVLVSCDAGALGRDAGLLARAGYRLVHATLVDQFVGTPHVEVVSRFDVGPA
jgi:23S rRNA (uracil1939-C5)-methyltransferase